MNHSLEASLGDFNNDIYRCQAYIYRHLDSSRHHLNKNWLEYKKITDAVFKEIGDVTKNIFQYRYRGNVLSTSMSYEYNIFKLPDDDPIIRYSGSEGRLLIHVDWSMVEVGLSCRMSVDIDGETIKTIEHNKHQVESSIRNPQYKNALMDSLKVVFDALITLLRVLNKGDILNNPRLIAVDPDEINTSPTTIDDKTYTDFVYNNSPKVVSKILRSHVIIEDILANSTLDDIFIVNQSLPGIVLYEFYQHDQKKDNGKCFGVGININGIIVYIANGFILEKIIPNMENPDYKVLIHRRWAEQLMKRDDEVSSVKQ